MKTKLILNLSALLIMLSAGVVLANSPHFTSAKASKSGSNLIVSFKEAGLGNGTTVTITASANCTAVYACINGGGNHPKAANKETVNSSVSASGTFTADRNGQVTGSLTLTPPPPPADFSCPSGQSLQLLSATYTNVQIQDATTGANQSIPGTF